MFSLKSKLYLVYNVFEYADFIRIDDMPPVIPILKDIKDDKENIAVTLPYKKYYKLKDVSFNEVELADTSCGKEHYSCVDVEGNKRKITFLKLKNMLKLKKNLDI
tara:strand:- start:37 stop:351 length:315 start_codon:yes stop_codon:yes gene_type:complete